MRTLHATRNIYEIYTKYTPNDENNPMKIIPLWWFRTRRKHIYDGHKNFGESILTPIVCFVQLVCNVLSNLSVSSVFVLNVCIICFVKIVKILKFGWDSEARFWSLVQILKQNLTTPISKSVYRPDLAGCNILVNLSHLQNVMYRIYALLSVFRQQKWTMSAFK